MAPAALLLMPWLLPTAGPGALGLLPLALILPPVHAAVLPAVLAPRAAPLMLGAELHFPPDPLLLLPP